MERVGETAYLLRFASPGGAARALARLEHEGGGRVADLVVGSGSLLVEVEGPGEVDPDRLHAVERECDREEEEEEPEPAGATHELEVGYDGADLEALAARVRLPLEEVVALHAGASYRVAFVGFQPGFAYLAGLPPALHAPRLARPRPRVPAGSVGIGGAWTGVYPAATPGGWLLIGTTRRALFDPGRRPPALLAPGDRVRFVPR